MTCLDSQFNLLTGDWLQIDTEHSLNGSGKLGLKSRWKPRNKATRKCEATTSDDKKSRGFTVIPYMLRGYQEDSPEWWRDMFLLPWSLIQPYAMCWSIPRTKLTFWRFQMWSTKSLAEGTIWRMWVQLWDHLRPASTITKTSKKKSPNRNFRIPSVKNLKQVSQTLLLLNTLPGLTIL